MTRRPCTFLLPIGAALSLIFVPAHADDTVFRTLVPEQEQVASIEVPQSELDIQLKINNPKGLYKVGETLELSVATNKDAYVTVVSVNEDKVMTVLYPYAEGTDNLVKPGELKKIAGKGTGVLLRFAEPVGTDVIKAFASTEKVPLLDADILATASGSKIRVAKAEIKTLVPEIEGAISETASSGKAEWATDSVSVTSYSGELPAAYSDAGQTISVSEPFSFSLASNKLVYDLGEPIKITASTEKECRLAIYNIGTSGAVRQLFPNKVQTDATLKAGQPMEISGAVTFSSVGPAGAETVLALCSEKAVPTMNEAADLINELFPKVGDWDQLSQKNLTLVATPEAQELGLGLTARAAMSLLTR
nr:DUF4384 domain-containing protein [uncultured Roseibium sp.]